MRINWEKYRNRDMSIDLVRVYKENVSSNQCALDYLATVSKITPIHSRQVSASVIATAKFISGDEND